MMGLEKKWYKTPIISMSLRAIKYEKKSKWTVDQLLHARPGCEGTERIHVCLFASSHSTILCTAPLKKVML